MEHDKFERAWGEFESDIPRARTFHSFWLFGIARAAISLAEPVFREHLSGPVSQAWCKEGSELSAASCAEVLAVFVKRAADYAVVRAPDGSTQVYLCGGPREDSADVEVTFFTGEFAPATPREYFDRVCRLVQALANVLEPAGVAYNLGGGLQESWRTRTLPEPPEILWRRS